MLISQQSTTEGQTCLLVIPWAILSFRIRDCKHYRRTFKTLRHIIVDDVSGAEYKSQLRKYDRQAVSNYLTSPLSIPKPNAIVATT